MCIDATMLEWFLRWAKKKFSLYQVILVSILVVIAYSLAKNTGTVWHNLDRWFCLAVNDMSDISVLTPYLS
jgi:hypothetical protein